MGLFGGGGSSTTTSKTSRPDYVNNMINKLADQEKTTQMGDYTDKQYAGLNANQLAGLGALSQSSGLQQLANQYTGAAQTGVNNLDYAYSGLNNLQDISGADVSKLAGQLYDYKGVQSAIDAVNQRTKQQMAEQSNPMIATQMQQQGFGSGMRTAQDMAERNAVNTMQNSQSDIANNAYNNAINQASSILSGNRQTQGAALSALGSNAYNEANLGTAAGSAQQQVMQNQLAAGNQQQTDTQNQMTNDYNNAINRQNWGYQQINNELGAADVLNSALGQTTKTTAPKQGSGMLGTVLSTAGAVVGGIYGGPAGAAIGAQLGGMAGGALSS